MRASFLLIALFPLLAMGCADLTVRTALRVSFCADNTAEDVDALLAGLRDGLQELQHI